MLKCMIPNLCVVSTDALHYEQALLALRYY
jgi:hypothetical protein